MLDENEFSDHENQSASWIALADLMTGLMAIFLVLCLVVLTNQDRTRIMIIQSVEEAMKEEGIKVETDPVTGDISIAENILFPYGSSQLSPAGQRFLNEFIPVYSNVLFNKLTQDQLDQVARVMVEGHGSRDNNTSADYEKNMTLSLSRANAVVQHVNRMPPFSSKLPFLLKLTPVGRGNIDAKPYDDSSDRKVIFKFQFASELFETTKDKLLNKQHQSQNIVPIQLVQAKRPSASGTTKFFRSPAGSIFCGFFTPSDPKIMTSVRCYIQNEQYLALPALADCAVQKNVSFTMWSKQEARIRCNVADGVEKAIFANKNNKKYILPYGRMITAKGIACLSQGRGITCSNANKEGFFIDGNGIFYLRSANK